MSSTVRRPVRRRRVFYIPGYDPFPPRRYRELYRKESAVQAALSGYRINLSAKQAGETFGWKVTAEIDGQHVRSDIEVLMWSDIVQQSRPHSVLGTYRDLFQTAYIYLSSGALFRLMRLRKGPVLAALYPVIALIGQALLAILLGWCVYRIVSFMMPEITQSPAAQVFLAGGAALLMAAVTLRWFHRHDGRFFAYYLMHDFAYSAGQYGAYPDALEARIAVFRQRLSAALRQDVDEVLVVGHSSGAYLGVSVLADAVRAGVLPDRGPALGFLSLGQVVAYGVLPAPCRPICEAICACCLKPATSNGSMCPHLGTAAVSHYAIRSLSRVKRRLPSKDLWFFQPLSHKACHPRAGRRCAGGSSDCIFSISVRLTVQRTMIISK